MWLLDRREKRNSPPPPKTNPPWWFGPAERLAQQAISLCIPNPGVFLLEDERKKKKKRIAAWNCGLTCWLVWLNQPGYLQKDLALFLWGWRSDSAGRYHEGALCRQAGSGTSFVPRRAGSLHCPPRASRIPMRARTTPTWRCEPALSALSKASSPQPQEKATKDAPPPPQTHAVPSRCYAPSTEKPLPPPAAVRLRSRPTLSRAPSASLSLCGTVPGGAGPPPLRGGRSPTVWQEALLGAVCVRTCVRVLRRVRVSEARAQGSSGQGRAERGKAGQEAQQDAPC